MSSDQRALRGAKTFAKTTCLFFALLPHRGRSRFLRGYFLPGWPSGDARHRLSEQLLRQTVLQSVTHQIAEIVHPELLHQAELVGAHSLG